MMFTFKQFIEHNNFICSLFEQDAAPPDSMPAAPQNPDNKTTNKHHFSFLKRQLGIDDDSLKSALEGNSMPVFQVPDYSNKWGFLVIGTCPVTVIQRPDNNFDVTFQLKDKQLMEPESFIKPYKKGQRPIVYQGMVSDKKEVVTAEELQDMMAKPFVPAVGGGTPPAAPPGGPPL